MMGSIGRNVCEKLFHMQVQRDEGDAAAARRSSSESRGARSNRAAAPSPAPPAATAVSPRTRASRAPRSAQGRTK
jgi:hypothetical protein